MRFRFWLTLPAIMAFCPLTQAQDEAEENFIYARTLVVERRDYDIAAQKFAAFVQTHPDHPRAPEAMSLMAVCFSNQQKDASAADAYLRLLKQYPNAREKLRAEAMISGGHAAFKVGRFGQAIELYTMLLKNFPRSPDTEEALLWRGEAQARLMNAHAKAGRGEEEAAAYEAALKDFEAFLLRYPASKRVPDVLYGAGFAGYDRQDYARAVEFFGKFLAEAKDDRRAAEAQYFLAESWYWQEAYPRARQAFEVVVAEYPRSDHLAEARSGIAWCDYAEGKLVDAARGFIEASRLCGEDRAQALSALYDAGSAFREAGKPEKAEVQFAAVAAAEGHPRRGKALFRLAEIKRDAARKAGGEARAAGLREAVRLFTEALNEPSVGESAPETAMFLGETYLDLRDFERAAQVFASMHRQWPDHRFAPYALYHLALARSQNEEYDKAATTIRELLRQYPKSRLRLQAAYAMAECQWALGKKQKSRLAYTWIADKGPAWAQSFRDEAGQPAPGLAEKARELAADSLFRLGESFYPDENRDAARSFYARLIAEYPESPQVALAHLRTAEMAELDKRYERAEEGYARALQAVGDGAGRANDEAARHARCRIGVVKLLRAQQLAAGEARAKLLEEALGRLGAFLAQRRDDPLAPVALYYRGEALYAQGKRTEALADYQAAYKADPKGEFADAALFGAAWCRRDLGDTDRARELFQRLVDAFPESTYRPDALYLLASDKREAREYDTALADAEAILADHPRSSFAARARIEKARILDAMGRHRDAVLELTNLLHEKPECPETPEALYALSWAWWGVSKPKFEAAGKAEAKYRALVGESDLESLAGARKVSAREWKAKWDELEQAARADEDNMAKVLKRLTREQPDFSYIDAVWLRLGEVSYDRRRYEDALEQYRKALEAAEKRAAGDVADKARYRLGWCHLRLARQYAKQARAAAPGERAALGEREKEAKRLALNAFESLVRHHPQSALLPECAMRAGELRREFEDYPTAVRLYEHALSAATGEAVARSAVYGKGVCQLEQGEAAAALATFKAFLAKYPEGELVHEANWGAGQALLQLDAYADAETFFLAAKSGEYAGEAAAKARYGLGMIAFRREAWERAREEFRKVDVFHSQWAEVAAMALLRASRASIELGQPDKAKADLERIIRRYGYTPAAAEAKALLAQLSG